jgi:hypothetical protein
VKLHIPGSQTKPVDMLQQEEASSEKKKKRSGVPKSRHGCKTCKYARNLQSFVVFVLKQIGCVMCRSGMRDPFLFQTVS